VIGPVFAREAVIAPRRASFYVARTVFAAALFALTLTSWQLLVGSQQIENPGDLAWFGAAAFQILAPLQLAVAIPFAALLVASAVALEKDRKTLDLLLLTNLTNSELVLGKLFAAMLSVVVVIVAAWPLLVIIALLGGVSTGQILRVQAVTLVSALAAGSLGSTIALWREKTFQALAMTVLVIVLWLVAWEVAVAGFGQRNWFGLPVETWGIIWSPWQAVQEATRPRFVNAAATDSVAIADPVDLFLGAFAVVSILLNAVAIALVRVWNPPREAAAATGRADDETATAPGMSSVVPTANVHRARGKVRKVWDNPILWREVRTWAFGRRVLLIRIAYWAVFLVCTIALVRSAAMATDPLAEGAIPAAAKPLVTLLIVGLLLLNALAVTSLTNERDSGALDLLLVTDLSPKEIVFGKLGGACYNAKEMILLPIALCIYLWLIGQLSTENLAFLLGGQLIMTAFAAMLGLHAGITYANSRTAIATSIGTLLFLFLGVAACMRIMLAFSNSFDYQFAAFLGFIAGGSVAMYVALGWRNPSGAIMWTSLQTPLLTFIVITSYLLGNFGTVFLITAATYGFATWAMLVPAIDVFDVAPARASAREE
jgi:ABC-type transport system involved in multi-copper enzyme maturation permease subunit